MKIRISKIDAAKAQLREAIRLFFEERDPISIHTLAGAALDVLNDHITDPKVVWDNNLFFHPDTIYIKDEYKKEFQDLIRKDKNFFKHADRDLKKGITETEFDPEVNEAYIFEAIRSLQIVAPGFRSPETDYFVYWFSAQNPNLMNEKGKEMSRKAQEYNFQSKSECLKAIKTIESYTDDYEDFVARSVAMAAR